MINALGHLLGLVLAVIVVGGIVYLVLNHLNPRDTFERRGEREWDGSGSRGDGDEPVHGGAAAWNDEADHDNITSGGDYEAETPSYEPMDGPDRQALRSFIVIAILFAVVIVLGSVYRSSPMQDDGCMDGASDSSCSSGGPARFGGGYEGARAGTGSEGHGGGGGHGGR